MIKRATVSTILLTLAFVGATIACGWWGVPLAAAIWGILRPQKNSALMAAVASVIAWGAVLVYDAWVGPMPELLHILSDVFQLPAPAVIALTLVFPAALAWSATEVCAAIRLRVAAP